MTKQSFKSAKIYTAKYQLSERWFVFYYYLDNGKYKRFKVYEDAEHNLLNGHRLKSVKERLDYFNQLATIVNNKLSNGWNPFGLITQNNTYMCIDVAISNVLMYKKNSMTKESFASFSSRIQTFQKWLVIKGYSYLEVVDIEHKHIAEFLFNRQIQHKISNRTNNNYLVDIKSMFGVMLNLGYIKNNPAQPIQPLNTRSNQHAIYTKEELKAITEHLKQHNPYLLLYCRFIWLGFRPIEITKLKVGNVNLEDKTITIEGKNEKTGRNRTKNILSMYFDDIVNMELSQYPKTYFLFSAEKKPSAKGTSRDYFTNHFQKVKQALNLPREYTMYGFRHTMCVELIKAGVSIKNIMAITGHTKVESFQCYIQKYLNEPGEDVSNMFQFSL